MAGTSMRTGTERTRRTCKAERDRLDATFNGFRLDVRDTAEVLGADVCRPVVRGASVNAAAGLGGGVGAVT